MLRIWHNHGMDFAAELARFNPDPALANWITGALHQHLDQAQKESAEVRRQITLRDTELRAAQTKIQALTLELAYATKPSPPSSAICSRKPWPATWPRPKPN